ncbi:Hypothetical predicted protein [Octopus vulgaris]|uniref:Uncharacterized protein n=1 Tax=Octopus vulgaris TaxID=6645 RepID=A0AA36BXK0_OCTVU|nr:Hypothetical predicted protein [Octopus vulgaris]
MCHILTQKYDIMLEDIKAKVVPYARNLLKPNNNVSSPVCDSPRNQSVKPSVACTAQSPPKRPSPLTSDAESSNNKNLPQKHSHKHHYTFKAATIQGSDCRTDGLCDCRTTFKGDYFMKLLSIKGHLSRLIENEIRRLQNEQGLRIIIAGDM